MARQYKRRKGKGKEMECGHIFTAMPPPLAGDYILCYSCDDYRLVL